MNINENLAKMPDKILHCLARTLQDEISCDCVKCLYCKYAPECLEDFKSKKYLFIDILNILERQTGVVIFLNPKQKPKEILNGSWLESYPDLLKKFTTKSFEEQQGILKDPSILQYMDNQ